MHQETILKFETNIDHLSAEEIGAALQILNEMTEVLDASYFSGLGKKNRPCGKLELLCHKEHEDLVARAIFRHTHSLGVRVMELRRIVLERSEGSIEMDDEKLRAKKYLLEGVEYLRPEADELIRVAKQKKLGLPSLRINKIKN